MSLYFDAFKLNPVAVGHPEPAGLQAASYKMKAPEASVGYAPANLVLAQIFGRDWATLIFD